MSESVSPNLLLNFQGVTCPFNYVKTKLALEEMDLGQVLEVIVDPGEPARHVPKSITDDGQKVLNTFTDTDGLFHVVIQKTVEY